MARDGKLKYPIIGANDAETKSDFDNVYGTGQSALDGVIRATNILFSGKSVVIAGYGHAEEDSPRVPEAWCQRHCDRYYPIKALRARMEGFEVMPMDDAAKIGDIFITATGCKNVITTPHFQKLKEGAVLANAGHFNVEVSISDLERLSKKKREIRADNMEYTLPNGNRLTLSRREGW